MRDENRIPKICSELERCWKAFPDWRLGQLIVNSLKDIDFYYVEDEELLHLIKDFSYKYAWTCKELIDNGKA